MVTRPNETLRWNENQTVGSEVAPTPDREANGYDSTASPPPRPSLQSYNWVTRVVGRWLRWLDQVAYRSHDVYRDQQLPIPVGGASIPSSLPGQGLAQLVGHFTTRAAFVGGYRVPPTDAPAHTYAPSADTYWDLAEDGSLTPVVVATGAPEPAVTLNQVRVRLVQTNATQITADGVFPDEVATRVGQTQQLTETGLLLEESVSTQRGILARAGGLVQSAVSSVAAVRRAIYHSSAGAHSGAGGNNAGETWEFPLNCRRGTVGYDRAVSGRDAYLIVLGEAGLEVLHRPASAADSWTHAVDGAVSGWRRIALLGEDGIQLDSLGATTPALNTLTNRNIIQAVGIVTTDGVGNASVVGDNLASASIVGGEIRVTFTTPIGTTGYHPLITPTTAGTTTPIPQVGTVETAYFNLRLRNHDGSAIDPATTVVGARVIAVGL